MINAFYADPHFGHKRICEYANRPFLSTEEMRDCFIHRYNAVVMPWDNCLWLGDAFLCPLGEAKEILRRMNGEKIIVRGNHDKSAAWLAKAGFSIVLQGFVNLRIADVPIRAGHYPYKYKNDKHESKIKELYPNKHRGEILLHGHTHTKDRLHGNQIHVGVDAWNYAPAKLSDIKHLIGTWFTHHCGSTKGIK